MSTTIEQDLTAVLGSVIILSPESFGLSGEPAIAVSAVPAPAGYPAHLLPAEPLVRALQNLLYARCYSHRLGDPVTDVPPPDPALVGRLSQANHSRERWDPGWVIYQFGANGQVYVMKGERQHLAQPGEYLAATPGLPLQVGSQVTLWVTRESVNVQPGFYYMFGEVPPDTWDDYWLVRYYFHCRPADVAELVAHLTASLNRSQVPFRMKALSDSAHYTRTDAMVLYCARRYHRVVAWAIAELSKAAAAALRPAVPLFSKRLRPGVGFAEDPKTGESFGMSRCRLVAEGIVDAWRMSYQSVPARQQAVAARFSLNGLSLERPYLNAGSVDLFDLSAA
jgi:hypothetical protein